MTDALQGLLRLLLERAMATRPVEAAAVLLGVGYILLAIRQKRGCWVVGGLSTALYVMVFLEARLYLQAMLQVLYVALAVYGWREWSRERGAPAGVSVRAFGIRPQALLLAAAVAATATTAPVLAAWSDASAPWADALGTWASVAATWMMIRKAAANWLWWIVIDCGLAALFASQGLPFTAALYLSFAALAAAGWTAWRRAPRMA